MRLQLALDLCGHRSSASECRIKVCGDRWTIYPASTAKVHRMQPSINAWTHQGRPGEP